MTTLAERIDAMNRPPLSSAGLETKGATHVSEEVKAEIRVGGEEIIHDLEPRWRALCDEVRSAPFHRPEWIAAYVRSFEPRNDVVLLTASTGDRLSAVLPMVRKRCFYAGVPLVKLTGTANSHSIRFDILRSPGAIGDAAVRKMWDLLSDTPGWQILELPLFPENGACSDLMTLASNDGYPTIRLLVQKSPTLRFKANGTAGPFQPVGGPNRHFRHELRRYARVLSAEAGAEPKVIRWSEASPDLLQEFFDLEEAGWKGRKGSAINCRPETLAFYRQIAKEGAKQGYFCMHSLEVKGALAAGAFSVATRDGFFPMKIAHDEALRRAGPGHLLFNAIASECAEKCIPELFFGGTEEHYKTLWTQETVPHFGCYVFSPDIRSRLAYRIRKNVLSPLGKLRWALRERFGGAHTANRRNGKNDQKAKQGHPPDVPSSPAKSSSTRASVQSL